jgi:hypothetical protein
LKREKVNTKSQVDFASDYCLLVVNLAIGKNNESSNLAVAQQLEKMTEKK